MLQGPSLQYKETAQSSPVHAFMALHRFDLKKEDSSGRRKIFIREIIQILADVELNVSNSHSEFYSTNHTQ